jgi:hypothetical protein
LKSAQHLRALPPHIRSIDAHPPKTTEELGPQPYVLEAVGADAGGNNANRFIETQMQLASGSPLAPPLADFPRTRALNLNFARADHRMEQVIRRPDRRAILNEPRRRGIAQ